MSFVKSSSVLPGTISDSSGILDTGESKEVEEEEPREDKRNGETKSADISALAEELVDKLECFKVGQEKISNLKMMAVKIETLYGAWSAGALTPQYLLAVLTAYN